MIDKYIKLILLSTILLQASPKLFNGYGNQLEPLNKDCKTYRKLSLLPKDIKKKCKLYNSKVNRAFKYGYKLDSSVDNDNVNLDKAEKYNSYLRELEENKDNIISLIQNEIYKASKPENIKYYSQLITSNAIALDDYNYRFMKKHKEKFNTNPKYIAFERDMYLKEEERLKEELYSLQIKNEKNEKVIRDLKRQKQKIQISSEKEVAKFRKSLKKAREIILSLRDKEKANIKNRMNTKTQVKSSTTCKQDMVYASSSAENATDYALKGNHKYALIEVKEAIIGTAQALESCKDKVESYKIDELSKNLSSLNVTKKQIESKLS
ncbi:MAG: hypothetical protein KAI79_15010, partial [Bacteroidales bacterium]|nr:hypothetical protein [Bacteroidales bacterium]